MFYNVLKIEALLNENEKISRKLLLQNGNSALLLISLKKDEIIETHTSKEDTAVFVIDGEIEMHFEAEKFTVSEGEIIFFEKDKGHRVLAMKDSKFFVIKI